MSCRPARQLELMVYKDKNKQTKPKHSTKTITKYWGECRHYATMSGQLNFSFLPPGVQSSGAVWASGDQVWVPHQAGAVPPAQAGISWLSTGHQPAQPPTHTLQQTVYIQHWTRPFLSLPFWWVSPLNSCNLFAVRASQQMSCFCSLAQW